MDLQGNVPWVDTLLKYHFNYLLNQDIDFFLLLMVTDITNIMSQNIDNTYNTILIIIFNETSVRQYVFISKLMKFTAFGRAIIQNYIITIKINENSPVNSLRTFDIHCDVNKY